MSLRVLRFFFGAGIAAAGRGEVPLLPVVAADEIADGGEDTGRVSLPDAGLYIAKKICSCTQTRTPNSKKKVRLHR